VQNGKQERDQALSVTENMLQANPDLQRIFSVNQNGSLGALAAIESSGLDVKLVNFDGAPAAIQAILKPNSHFTPPQYNFPVRRLAWGSHSPWQCMTIGAHDW
jgi:ribose transport system substrate-binding protein